MAQPLRNPDDLQKNLAEFQEISRQMQMMGNQRQQLMMQLEEIKMAEEELAKSEKGIYRAIGPLLVETSKTDALADLKEKKDLFDMRTGILAKQEEKLKPKMEELRAILEKAIKENRLKQG